jgi:alkyl hydroperoxide reductase subunit AhpC
MYHTLELGPLINTPAPGFAARNHGHQKVSLDEVMGDKGLLLGFISDIWLPASVRRILWLQRHAGTFMRVDVNLALVICDQPQTLYGFRVSSPLPLEFPLLADVDHAVHRLYNMDELSGLVMVNANGIIRHKWLVPDERVWPNVNELLDAAKLLR